MCVKDHELYGRCETCENYGKCMICDECEEGSEYKYDNSLKETYKITVTDTATYYIKADDMEDAIDIAVEWFSEREPDVRVEETDEEAEYEVITGEDI